MRFLFILLVTAAVIFTSCREDKVGEGDIVIENEQLRLIIGTDGITRSLIYKPTNEECLIDGVNLPIFSITQERPFHNEIKLSHPNKKMTFQSNSIRWEYDKLIVGFDLIFYNVVIDVTITPQYIRFSLEDFIIEPGDFGLGVIADNITPPIHEINFLQLPVRDRKYFGEWLNVSWDDDIAINVLGTDHYARIDSEKREGYRIMIAGADRYVKLRGVGAALIVSRTDELLDNIARVEEDFDLPRGVESRRHELYNASYYSPAGINPGNVDQHLRYAKMGGFRTMKIDYSSFVESGPSWSKKGDYNWIRSLYPNGRDDLEKMLNKIKDEGIAPGFHFLHTHIGRDSKYVTPVPDHRLNLLRHFTLAEPLGKTDTEIYIEQNPMDITMADGMRVLKIGTELISYESYTTTWPYKFTGCTRSIDGTTVNSQPRGYIFGLLDVSEFGWQRSVYIDQNTSLQDEIAEKIADIFNAGFKFCYFDGSEGVNPPFWFNVAGAQWKVFKRLDPEPIFSEGAAKTHFTWHMLSGGNAFDVFRPEVLKEEIKKWPAEQAPRMKADFSRVNFGWLGYFLPGERTVGTQPDMLEYATSRAAAWDCPVSLNANLNNFEAHPRTPDNLEVLRRWEEVRARNWLTEDQKLMLQDLDHEHILLINEQEEFELLPYDQIDSVANGSREVRAFIFERGRDIYVVYWHISGYKRLELPVSSDEIILFGNIGKEKAVDNSQNNNVIIPVGDRHYLKTSNLTRDELIAAFENAKILEN
jgi:hypothetical protein